MILKMFKTSSILLFVAACLLSTCAAFDFNDIEIDTRVVQGENATRGQFPFYVLLKVKMAQGTAACGGSLISNEYVVTVSHFQYFWGHWIRTWRQVGTKPSNFEEKSVVAWKMISITISSIGRSLFERSLCCWSPFGFIASKWLERRRTIGLEC